MPENNIPFEVTYERAKARIAQTISALGKELQVPSPLLVIILRDIANENQLGILATTTVQYELVSPEQYAELRKAKEFYDNAMSESNEEVKED